MHSLKTVHESFPLLLTSYSCDLGQCLHKPPILHYTRAAKKKLPIFRVLVPPMHLIRQEESGGQLVGLKR